VALVVACGGRTAPPPRPVPPVARVEVAATTCVAREEVETRLGNVLVEHRAMQSGLVVRIEATPGEATTALGLRVVRPNGDVGLDRTFTLTVNDCASAAQLLALSVDRWLTAFPEWAEPPPPPAPPKPVTTWNELALAGALNSMWMPVGADAQLGARVDRGGLRDRFGATLLVRASIPQGAGNGSFQQTSLLAGASWRHRVGSWEARVEARAGALLVSGIGFSENGRDVLPWWEGAVFGGRRFRWGAIGVEVAATALQHRAVTRDLLVAEDIPLLRVGIAGSLEIP
jgi:hypothetical protein